MPIADVAAKNKPFAKIEGVVESAQVAEVIREDIELPNRDASVTGEVFHVNAVIKDDDASNQ